MAIVIARRLGSAASALGALLIAVAAGADGAAVAVPEPVAQLVDPNAWERAPAIRRSGFVVGGALGEGAASIVGFPNDAKKIGYAPYYTATGARPSPLVELWIGGALSDWFTFGLGFTEGGLLFTRDEKALSLAGVFHVEMFPLFYVNDALRDLGVMFDAGTGTASVTASPDVKLVDGSAASLVGGGIFWEPARWWHSRGGPFLMGNYVWSDTARRPGIFAGWRVSLYSGP